MDLKDQVNKLFTQEQGYDNWSLLLQFFQKHKNILDNNNKKRIYNRIEQYRTDHNETYPNDPIRREDITPPIYENLDYAFLEEKEEKEQPHTDLVCA